MFTNFAIQQKTTNPTTVYTKFPVVRARQGAYAITVACRIRSRLLLVQIHTLNITTFTVSLLGLGNFFHDGRSNLLTIFVNGGGCGRGRRGSLLGRDRFVWFRRRDRNTSRVRRSLRCLFCTTHGVCDSTHELNKSNERIKRNSPGRNPVRPSRNAGGTE